MAAEDTQLALNDSDRARLEGAEGSALRLAMGVVVGVIVRAGEILGAERLIDVGFAHIDDVPALLFQFGEYGGSSGSDSLPGRPGQSRAAAPGLH
jgi:predicted aconitase